MLFLLSMMTGCRSRLAVWMLAVVAGAGLAAAETAPDPSRLPPAATRVVEFAKEVRPILERSCVSCHGPERQKGGFRVDSLPALIRGGETHAPAIVPGKSAESPLIYLVAGLIPDSRMPAKGDPLSPAEIGTLRAWIDQGAKAPDSAHAEEDPIRSHWAFRPVRAPPIPAAEPSTRGRAAAGSNPIDAFVATRLKHEHLTPSPEADRVTLIRRLYFVMLGMPPSPEDVAAFVSDRKPQAFERLVDRVLDDPRYGERWARHWLDLVRFAESNGFETNRERLSAWRFRDYVIAAFNQDKPFDRFVREQIAGDALGADVATGFLVGGPVDIVGSPDPTLTLQQRADELDDMVSTTGTAFLGLTLGCARCHSHKFDPISHREYYSMAALFAGVRHGERPLPLPAGRDAELKRLQTEIAGLERQLARFQEGATPAAAAASLRPPVDFAINREEFPVTEARWIRFSIQASSGGEPCLDELEVWAGTNNVALARRGTRATASGTLPGFAAHALEHIHDGKYGNNFSWISDESGGGWVQLELAKPEHIERVVWGRDREGTYRDRLPTEYRIEVASKMNEWRLVASSADRTPWKAGSTKSKAPVYRFEGWSKADADDGRRALATLEALRKQRESLAKSEMVYAGNFVAPGVTHRLNRGDPMSKREPVAPGTLAIFRPLTLSTNASEQERRVALAEWIASPENPLTARVIVNRIWQHQFGAGLVSTPNDFGRNGAKPTHPELLDWLAADLVSHGWSLKRLQRQILTSAAWRQSSRPRPEALHVDAGSRLLWRFPPRRLEAEGIRDTMLSVSGNLDRTAGGPAFYLHDVDRENVYHYQPKERFGPAESRRMIYAFKVRMEQDGIFGAFDCPDGSLVTPKRSMSTTPLQALNLFNSRFVLDEADQFAARLHREAGDKVSAQIRRAWVLAYNRDPDRREAAAAAAFVAGQGLPALCRALLNSSEFVFIP